MTAPSFNKVPLVTLYFWIIKILSTTVGETGADYLIFDLGWGLALTSLVAVVAMAGVLVLQFRRDRYVPWTYWLTVVFLSIVGTLVTDNLTDNLGVSLYASTAVFAVALAATFWVWWKAEHTLSIHAINTVPRESYYWAAILLTFALGTAAGDLLSEEMGLGYALSGAIFGAGITARICGPQVRFAFQRHRVLGRLCPDETARCIDRQFPHPARAQRRARALDDDDQWPVPDRDCRARRLHDEVRRRSRGGGFGCLIAASVACA
jgi:uncharacterized membrane-anchored protein